jgi:Ring finger domain
MGDGGAAKYTDTTSSSFFRLGLLLSKGNNKGNNLDNPEGTSNTSADDDARLPSEMLLIGFNICSALLIALRCYYHYISWKRANRKEVLVVEDLRLKAEKKLQDMDDEQQQKWTFWTQSLQQQQQHQPHQHQNQNPNITHTMLFYNKGDYTGQACPICWQEFQQPPVVVNPFVTDTTTATKEEPLVCDETTCLLSNTKRILIGGSDGKPIKSLPCGHSFDRGCLVEWVVTLHKKNLDSPLTCPVCREAF